jgi:putative ABC transport system permease protein
MASEEKREIIFPMGEAFRYCLESIRKRFTRAIITALSIVLGIAFLVTLLTMAAILGAQAGGATGGAAIAAYQYWMVIIALLVCGVGIVNSMLMSVTERYKEIGTMKCLGATSGVILEIFLIESALLGLLGGVIGSAIGLSAAIITYGFQLGWTVIGTVSAVTYVYNFGLAIIVALLLSIVAAMYPALYAARLDPVAALRYEI